MFRTRETSSNDQPRSLQRRATEVAENERGNETNVTNDGDQIYSIATFFQFISKNRFHIK